MTALPQNFGPSIAGLVGLTAAGTDQGTAFQIITQLSVFYTVASGTGCRLPVPSGSRITIRNQGANDLLVYPASGDQINDESVDDPVTISAGNAAAFECPAANLNAAPRIWWQTSSTEGGGGGLPPATVAISKTALTTMNSSPITIVAAPASDKKLVPNFPGFLQYSGGASKFGFDTPVKIKYDGDDDEHELLFGSILVDGTGEQNVLMTKESAYASTGFSAAGKALVAYMDADAGTWGAIASSTLNDGGADYAALDTFTVDGGTGSTGVVDTVDGGGAVLTYHLTANGNSYTTTTGDTTTATTGIGTGLLLNIVVSVIGTGNASINLSYREVDALVAE